MSSIVVHAAVVVVTVNECLWPANDGDNDGADDDVSAFNTHCVPCSTKNDAQ